MKQVEEQLKEQYEQELLELRKKTQPGNRDDDDLQ